MVIPSYNSPASMPSLMSINVFPSARAVLKESSRKKTEAFIFAPQVMTSIR